MRTVRAIALCGASLVAGVALGFFASKADLDAELRAAVAEKDRLIAEMTAAAAAVKESGARLASIRARMAVATNEADRAASDIAGKASTIEELVNRLKAYALDARGKLRQLSAELGKAVDENQSGVDRIDGLLKGAGVAEAPR